MKLNKLSLNTIGLNRIGLNRIGSTSVGSSVTDRPYISPDVLSALAGVWIADGKSNTDPDRNIIKNKLPGRGGDFELLNFAYKLNSGYGKYEEDFTAWGRDASELLDVRSDKVIISDVGGINSYRMIIWKGNSHTKAFKAKVTGIPRNGRLIYSYAQNEGDALTNISIDNDGVYEFPYSYGFTNGHGFLIDSGTELEDWIGCTIEFIPSFQGSLCTDGVNDMIVSQNPVSEMLDGSKELTVVSMIHQISLNSTYKIATTNYLENIDNTKHIRSDVYNSNKTGIYGYTASLINNTVSDIKNILGDKADYYVKYNDINEALSNSKFSVVGRISTLLENSSVAWYWTFIAKRALTTDEINQVIAYYNLDKYVKPDIYYNVKKQGLTNDTPDEDWYLKDFSGNGRDMTLYNYARTPESGINEEGGLQSDGVDDYGQFVGDLGLKDYTVAVDRAYVQLLAYQVPLISEIKSNGITPFIFEYVDSNKVNPFSFGDSSKTNDIVLNRKVSYQSTYVYNGLNITKGTATDTGKGITIGRYGDDRQYANIVLWSFLLFPYTLSEFLLERQLKKHKLGTLYPGMVEFRPIISGRTDLIKEIKWYSDSWSKRIYVGDYIPKGVDVTANILLNDNTSELVKATYGNNYTEVRKQANWSETNNEWDLIIHNIGKSPQKINIVISSYLTMLDNETLITNETLIKNE